VKRVYGVCQYIFSGRRVCVRHASHILSATSLVWKDKVGRYVVKLTQGLTVSLHVKHSWTIPSGSWSHRQTLFSGEPEELIRVFHRERLRQEELKKAGHYSSPKWTVFRSSQHVYGAKKIRGYTIIDSPLFFESVGRKESVHPTSRNMGGEGSSSTQGEGNSSIFWGDNQGPVVMVWDGMLPGEQESAKKIITEESPTFSNGTGRDSTERESNRRGKRSKDPTNLRKRL
jgi:hypothetical protein